MNKQLLMAMALLCPAAGLAEDSTWTKIANAIKENKVYKTAGDCVNATAKGLNTAKDGIVGVGKSVHTKLGDGADWVADHCNRKMYENMVNHITQFPGQSWETIKANPIITAAVVATLIAAGVVGYKLAKKEQKPKK